MMEILGAFPFGEPEDTTPEEMRETAQAAHEALLSVEKAQTKRIVQLPNYLYAGLRDHLVLITNHRTTEGPMDTILSFETMVQEDERGGRAHLDVFIIAKAQNIGGIGGTVVDRAAWIIKDFRVATDRYFEMKDALIQREKANVSTPDSTSADPAEDSREST